MLPFAETLIGECEDFILVRREFFKDTPTEELCWHRDREDREVSLVSGQEWYLQIDDELPRLMCAHKKFFIPKNIWHRLISKNRTNLVIDVKKFKDECSNSNL